MKLIFSTRIFDTRNVEPHRKAATHNQMNHLINQTKTMFASNDWSSRTRRMEEASQVRVDERTEKMQTENVLLFRNSNVHQFD